MQDRVKTKWNVTDEEFKQAADELCAKGIGKGCFQNTNALRAPQSDFGGRHRRAERKSPLAVRGRCAAVNLRSASTFAGF